LVDMCIFAFPTTFATSVFFSFHIKNAFPIFRCPEGSKQVLFCEGATKGSVQDITTLIFMGGGPTRGAKSRRLGIILACCHIMNYVCPKSILIQFCTGATRNAHQKNRGKIQGGPLGVWDPRTGHGCTPGEEIDVHVRLGVCVMSPLSWDPMQSPIEFNAHPIVAVRSEKAWGYCFLFVRTYGDSSSTRYQGVRLDSNGRPRLLEMVPRRQGHGGQLKLVLDRLALFCRNPLPLLPPAFLSPPSILRQSHASQEADPTGVEDRWGQD
jgi:hypothetical protein